MGALPLAIVRLKCLPTMAAADNAAEWIGVSALLLGTA